MTDEEGIWAVLPIPSLGIKKTPGASSFAGLSLFVRLIGHPRLRQKPDTDRPRQLQYLTQPPTPPATLTTLITASPNISNLTTIVVSTLTTVFKAKFYAITSHNHYFYPFNLQLAIFKSHSICHEMCLLNNETGRAALYCWLLTSEVNTY